MLSLLIQMANSKKISAFVPVLGMPTSVIKYDDPNKTESKKKLFLMIPGRHRSR